MRKPLIYSGIVILLAAVVFLTAKYYKSDIDQPVIQTFSTKQNPAFKAVPLKSPMIIEVKNQEGFYNTLKGENKVFGGFKGIPEFDAVISNISRFRDFIAGKSGILNLLKAKSVIISVNPSGKNQLSNLYLVQFNDQNESGNATGIVSNELGADYSITRRNYDNTVIFNAKSEDQNFYFTTANDIFMISEDFILIEESIRQSKSQGLLNNQEFTETYKTIEETAFANIFINHLTIQTLLAKMVSPEIRKTIGQLASYSSWSELDLTANNSELIFNGYSVTRDSSDNYLNIFRNQEAGELTIDQVIPANASYFVALNLKNTSVYLNKYETYLRAKGDYYPREMGLIEFQKKTKTDAAKLIREVGGNQFAGVYTTINKSDPTQNRFFIAELLDNSEAIKKLDKAVSEFSKTSKTEQSKLHFQYSIDSKSKFDIYRLPIANMAESLFGRAFSGLNANYFTVYNDYLICGDNLPGLKSYLQNIATEKTMANDSIYKVSNKAGRLQPNFYLYAKIPKIYRLKDILFNTEVRNMLSKNEDIIRKYTTFSWQFTGSADNKVENRLVLKYDPNLREEPEAIWQLKLNAPLAQRPKFVLNHKDLPNREVIVYDKENNVSLINKEGEILWTIKIPGEIISDIHQIDIYQTKRFQYLFNTKTQLYVVDRLGNNVGKYPVNLKFTASNGVLVAEYGKNREYRYFIAGEDKKVYVFDRDGKIVPNWKFVESETIVSKPIQHFDIEGKDYLVFSDLKNTYFLDRQGKSRDLQPLPFDHSDNPMYFIPGDKPRLISTDLSGQIHILDFTGEQEIKEVGKFGANHRFATQDLDGNGTQEYLFADGKKLSVFAADGKILFERSLPEVISETPFVCTMGPGIFKIGVVVKAENKVYLLDKNGSISWGFPLEGNTNFVVGKFNDYNAWINLIVGGEGNGLVNYRVE